MLGFCFQISRKIYNLKKKGVGYIEILSNVGLHVERSIRIILGSHYFLVISYRRWICALVMTHAMLRRLTSWRCIIIIIIFKE